MTDRAALSGTTANPIERGGWKFWIAEDGAVCIQDEDDERGVALSWNTFDTIYTRLAAAERRASQERIDRWSA